MTVLAVDTQPSVWAAAPGSGEGTLVGRNADTPLGFCGTTPIVRPELDAATATAPQIAAALIALGLVAQS
ncbi:MAG TPA: hypothetical protein VFH85_07750 [Gammaproteobacteria bacterium]|nr:hypothetical protein [Gammaproteobacteria bacterium]